MHQTHAIQAIEQVIVELKHKYATMIGNEKLLVAYYYNIFACRSNWILRKQLSQCFDVWDKVVALTVNHLLGISKF